MKHCELHDTFALPSSFGTPPTTQLSTVICPAGHTVAGGGAARGDVGFGRSVVFAGAGVFAGPPHATSRLTASSHRLIAVS